MKTYHINPDTGNVNVCSAVKQCAFAENGMIPEHYESKVEAQLAYEKKMDGKATGFKLQKKSIINKSVSDKVSADISKNYAHISIIEEHMHNAGDIGNTYELYYYSSPAGRKELKRRIGINSDNTRKEYLAIQETIDNPGFVISGVDNYMLKNQEKIDASVIEGYGLIIKDFGDNDAMLLNKDLERDTNAENAMRHTLAEESYKWYKNISTEEQEAIGHLTSNGFMKLQYHLGYLKDDDTPPSIVFSDTVDRNSLYFEALDNGHEDPDEIVNEAYKKAAKEFSDNVLSSFSHAPKLDNPVMTYRGTSINEVRDLLGVHDGKDLDAWAKDDVEPTNNLVDDIVKGKYDGKMINPESRINNIPVSTAVSPFRAKNFGDGEVFLEIKRYTSTSPVNNGAWGSAETEMLSNPLSDYKIIGATETWDEYGKRKGVVLRLEEIPVSEKISEL